MYTITILGLGFVILTLIRWLVRRSWKYVDTSNEISAKGKIVLITGANSGLGKSTALEFACRDAHVVLACRDLEKANGAVNWIRQKTSKGILTCMKLDLSSLHSIRLFCTDFKSRFDKIDILINNAGVVMPESSKMKTLDGFEIHMGVNHLGHFLLVNLLLDLLKRAAPSRIVTLSSTTHSWSKLDLDDILSERKTTVETIYSTAMSPMYAKSKLAIALFNKELAKRLDGTGVHCYALCPGMVATNIARNLSSPKLGIIMLTYPILRYVALTSPQEGCETTIYCALSKDLINESGEMYRYCGYWDPKSRVTLKEEDAEKLWKESEKIVGLS